MKNFRAALLAWGNFATNEQSFGDLQSGFTKTCKFVNASLDWKMKKAKVQKDAQKKLCKGAPANV